VQQENKECLPEGNLNIWRSL